MTPPVPECNPTAPGPKFGRILRGAVLGLALLASVWTLMWLQKQPAPVATGSIELKRGVEFLPNSTMKAHGLHLPRAGRLTINLSSESGEVFSIFLVSLNTGRPVGRGNELRLMEDFSAERVTHYARSATVEPGEYHLTLINSAPAPAAHELNLSILVRLDP